METKREAKLPYYLVVATAIALCFGPASIPTGCAGIFYPSIMEYLTISKATLAIYQTIMGLSITVMLPFIGRFMEKIDLRIMLSLGVISVGGTLIAMSFFTEIWHWYIAAVFLGFGVAICLFLAVPVLIGRWFKERVGFFIGLCMAFTGVGGIVFNALGGMLIASGPEGWRLGYFVFGVLCLAITLPFTVLAVRSFPAEKGLLPFGAKDEAANKESEKKAPELTGISAAVALKTPVFFALAVFAGLVTLASVYFQFIPTYCVSFKDAVPAVAAASATAASLVALGQAVGKISLGLINDKNVTAGLLVGIIAGILGFLILWFLPFELALLLIGCFLFGMFYALTTVQVPFMTRVTFGMKEYSKIFARISMVSALAVALGALLWGLVIDLWGFTAVHILLLAMAILGLLLGLYVLRAGKRLKNEHD